jgi:Protein of unknown function (DUF3134)
MVTRHNPALRQESLNQPARIIPPRELESLFTWIEGTGRFQSNEFNEFDESHYNKVAEELEDIMDSNHYEDKDEPEEEMEL